MKHEPETSIVVPHIGSLEPLKRCIESVKASIMTADKSLFEIIVVADKPDTGIVEYLKSESYVRAIINDELTGIEAALNKGLVASKGKYLCYLMSDVEVVTSEAFDKMKEALEKYPEFGWVALSSEHTGFLAGCSMWSRATMEKIGLWDESYSAGYGFSDDDYLRRMLKLGFKPHIVDGVKVSHQHISGTGVTLYSEEQRKKRFAKNQALFYQKWGETGTNWDTLPKYIPPADAGKAEKILCVCNLGAIRSQCLALLLTDRRYDAKAVGWMPNAFYRATDNDYRWADKIISLVEDSCYSQFIASVPTEYHKKIERYNIGPDKWSNPNHPDLVATLTKMVNNNIKIGGKTIVEEKKMLCLNLGSFVDVVKDSKWVNIDILPLREHIPPEVKFKQWDIRRNIPYPDNSVDLIRASHIIEHLTLEEAKNLLREIYRTLKPGGLARIATPDLDIIVKHYYNRDMSFFNAVEQPPEYIQAPTIGEKFSRLLFSGDYQHKAIYTFDMLKNFLEQAGFTRIFKSVPGFSHSEHMQMESEDAHIPISLFVEAVR